MTQEIVLDQVINELEKMRKDCLKMKENAKGSYGNTIFGAKAEVLYDAILIVQKMKVPF